MTDFFKMVLLPTGAVLAFFVAIFWSLMAYQCQTYESVTGKPTKMAGGSCYINQSGQWMMWEEYKLRNATHEKDAIHKGEK